LRWSFSCKCHDGSGGGAIHANLETLDAGIEPTWRCAWLVVEAGVVAPMLALERPCLSAAALDLLAMAIHACSIFWPAPTGSPLPKPASTRSVPNKCKPL
jgi:hypothetical protein